MLRFTHSCRCYVEVFANAATVLGYKFYRYFFSSVTVPSFPLFLPLVHAFTLLSSWLRYSHSLIASFSSAPRSLVKHKRFEFDPLHCNCWIFNYLYVCIYNTKVTDLFINAQPKSLYLDTWNLNMEEERICRNKSETLKRNKKGWNFSYRIIVSLCPLQLETWNSVYQLLVKNKESVLDRFLKVNS